MKNDIILFSKSTQFLTITEKYIKSYDIDVFKCISNFDDIYKLTEDEKKKIFVVQFKENGHLEKLLKYFKKNKITWIAVSSNRFLNFSTTDNLPISYLIISETPTITEYKKFLKDLAKKILQTTEFPSLNFNNFDKSYKKSNVDIIAIGASTGGTEAVEKILLNLDEHIPPIIVVLHMPPVFTSMYANRLNEICKMNVREAKDGEILRPGVVFIAPGGYQTRVKKYNNEYIISCTKEGKFNGHQPSVDILFESVANYSAKNVIAIILTGMGSDGANGILKIKQNGGYTIGQDKESCIVYGMPKVAYEIGGISKQASLDNISNLIQTKLKSNI